MKSWRMSDRQDRLAFVYLALFSAAAILVAYIFKQSMTDALVEPDSYLRLVRIEQLLKGGGWFNDQIDGAHADMHWTRLYDIVLTLFALPFMLFAGLHDGLHLAGMWIAPLMYLLSGALGFALLRRVMPRPHAVAACLFFLCNLAVFRVAIVGYADYHMFFLFLEMLWGAFLLKAFQDGALKDFAISGLLLGASLWAAQSALLFLGISTFVFLVIWVKNGGKEKEIQAYFGAFFVALCIAFLSELPSAEWGRIMYDRLSLPHLSMGALLYGAAASLSFYKGRSVEGRFVFISLLISVCFSLYVFFFPGFLAGPMAAADSYSLARIYFGTGEAQPLLKLPFSLEGARPYWWGGFLPLLVLGAGLVLWKNRKDRATFFAIAGLLLSSCAVLYQVRFIALTAFFGAVLFGGCVGPYFSGRKGCVSALCLFPLMVLFLAWQLGSDMSPWGPYQDVARWVQKNYPAEKGEVLFSLPSVTPLILWETDYEVIGIPYHRTGAPIKTADSLVVETDMAALYPRFKKRHVRFYILAKHILDDLWMTRMAPQNSLFDRIHKRNLPPVWLEKTALPPQIGAFMRLYCVKGVASCH